MKFYKFFTVNTFIFLITCSSMVFATGIYSGDLQVQFGYRFDSNNATLPLNAGNAISKSNAYEISFENYNLFNINDMLSIGFMENMEFFWGKVTDFSMDGYPSLNQNHGNAWGFINFALGPAIGVRFGNIVRLQGSIALAMNGLRWITPFNGTYTIGNTTKNETIRTTPDIGIGFALGVQAKFFPKSVVSPLVGLRYMYLYAADYSTNNGRILSVKSEDKLPFQSNTFSAYIGVSINWGSGRK